MAASSATRAVAAVMLETPQNPQRPRASASRALMAARPRNFCLMLQFMVVRDAGRSLQTEEGDLFFERFLRERFHQVFIGAGGERGAHVRHLVLAGDHDDLHAVETRVSPDLLHEL